VEAGLRRAEPAAVALLTETLRIDIDRLDVLLNLVGELLVNRARFSQVLDTIGQLFQKSAHSDRLSLITESLNGVIHTLDHGVNVDLAAVSQELTSQIEVLKHETHTWNEGRNTFTDLVAAVDQLTRVSKSLQQVVLSTRMVPVGPLFSRFRRSVRDMAWRYQARRLNSTSGSSTSWATRSTTSSAIRSIMESNQQTYGPATASLRRRPCG
jgi:two-component system chemotaxis sensor kinase CheA